MRSRELSTQVKLLVSIMNILRKKKNKKIERVLSNHITVSINNSNNNNKCILFAYISTFSILIKIPFILNQDVYVCVCICYSYNHLENSLTKFFSFSWLSIKRNKHLCIYWPCFEYTR